MKFLKEKSHQVWEVVKENADSKTAYSILASTSFVSSFFASPPPEIALGAMTYARPKRWFYLAFLGAVFGALGAVAGYVLGLFLFESVGMPVLSHLGLMDAFRSAAQSVHQYTFWTIFVAAFSLIPTIPFIFAAGFVKAPLVSVFIAMFLARLSRNGIFNFVVAKYGVHAARVMGRFVTRTEYMVAGLVFVILLLVLFFR